ncbi:MAG: transcription termination/antitermination protein NusA [Desulfomicrobiaceae bacterium]|jgi:N utilization substance protein A|nr:transcription termination/antitermination protein NusA [Desulfomicrobiaceae bacterium]MBZ4684448.1 transcription termination/antitermination protein NusA [Desulfomicrobiaceae bacterium]MDI3492272.1 transcription termination/antitermination protein NusA [Desulfomicrobiaceae bacterium]MDK2872948.1 transcription termination/antitermination protein NusA [Desulfomicrobiaceae bacterium]HCF04887.1 transcription termination/antitermination protein NusA [Desulfomicrobiaceae bacterium]
MNLELKKVIDQISKDKGIDRDLLIDTLEEAIRASVIKKYGDGLDIEVTFNDETGDIEVFQFKIVVDKVHDPDNEISLEEARQHDPNVELDDEMGFRLHVEDLGRIAAQSAKQVLIQRMRDAEQEIIYEEYKNRKNEIVSGIIQRRDRAGWIVNLGRTEALLPKEQQIPREHFRQGDRVEGLIIDVRKEGRGPQIIISRSHPDYMVALFRREVPEVADGTVNIMSVARDPGLRAKVAVLSQDSNVDPVGACVGVRGSRIHNIVQELRGERIDIVLWSPDIATYAANALSPARIAKIIVDDEEKTLEVVVPDDQLTPAIGKKGQNVKLAAKLLGWKIDIHSLTRFNQMYKNRQQLEQVANAAQVSLADILDAGFDSLEALAAADNEDLMRIRGVDEDTVGILRTAINLLSPKVQPRDDEAESGSTLQE